MKQKTTPIIAVFAAIIIMLTGVLPVFASNTVEIESYLDTTYAKAIDPYGNLQKDEQGRFIIPLSKTSVTLKKDSYSKLYTPVWSSSDEDYAKITSNYSSSATAKITHPSAKDGDKEVIMTLTLSDKNDPSKVLASRDYILVLTAQLPVYNLTVTAKNAVGSVIENAQVSVCDNRNIPLRDNNGVFALNGSTAYNITVSAPGYIRNMQTITLSDDKNLEVILEQGTTVNFKVKTVSGSLTDYATIKVTSQDTGKSFGCVLDEYGYETPVFELKNGTYKYDITYQNGSQNAAGTFTVEQGNDVLDIPVQLKNTEYKIKFNTDPADAIVTLYKNGSSGAYGDPILPDSNGYYTIIFGQYRYNVEADGFTAVSKTFNATDTSLKNNGYVIDVKLLSPYDQVLSDADDILFSVLGNGLMLNEYSGLHSDIDFGYWADIDSDYDDVNINETIEKYIAGKLKSDKPVRAVISSVENEDGDIDYRVIEADGTIHYDYVTDDMLNYDETGAEFHVKLTLICENRTKESEVTVIVPKHIMSRQERLDKAAEYACSFDRIKGNNISTDKIENSLVLEDISSDISNDFTYYSICSQWSSDHPDIINPLTGEVSPAKNDTNVILTVKTYYSEAQIEDGGFLFDPGPLGENESIRTIELVVPGTDEQGGSEKPGETDKPSLPKDNIKDDIKNPHSTATILSEKKDSDTSKENNKNTGKHSPATGSDIVAVSIAIAFAVAGTATVYRKKKYETE